MNQYHSTGDLAERLDSAWQNDDTVDYSGLRIDAVRLIEHLQSALFPQFGDNRALDTSSHLTMAADELLEILQKLSKSIDGAGIKAGLFGTLPEIQRLLLTDIDAAYEGDPAATGRAEIILSYPAFFALCTYRIAHTLYSLHVPILPRVMTEIAHARTGIDIHPGATIGESFFIDHGTGVVIGETTIIGNHVKLYQGVTLGAKSFPVGPDGTLVKGIKRHPYVGNNVVIYAGAVILGGNTKIGDNCVIGGNAWITHSVNDGTTVPSNYVG